MTIGIKIFILRSYLKCWIDKQLIDITSVISVTECDVPASQAAAALKIFIQLRWSNGLTDTLKDEQRMVY